MTTAFPIFQPDPRATLKALHERQAATAAALVEAANFMISDREKLNEAIRQADSAMRLRNLSIIAAIGAQSRIPAAASLPVLLAVQDAPRDVGPVTSYDQALYLLSRGWKPVEINSKT